jgi:hypothetical protein
VDEFERLTFTLENSSYVSLRAPAEDGVYDVINAGGTYLTINDSNIRFPSSGDIYKNVSTGTHRVSNLGNQGRYYTSSPSSDGFGTLFLYFVNTGTIYPANLLSRTTSPIYAFPVRCVKNANLTITDPEDGGTGSGTITQ